MSKFNFHIKFINKGKRGFTLVEIVIVMAITAVVAVLIIGAIVLARQAARDAKYRNDGKTVRDLLEVYYSIYKRYPCDLNPDGVTCKAGTYSRTNAYSFFDKDVTPNYGKVNAKGELGADGAKIIDPSLYPTGDADRLCYTTWQKTGGVLGSEYLLWYVTEEEVKKGEGCHKGGGGWPWGNKDGAIHGTNMSF